MKVSIKRAYESSHPHDGYRVLVDRLWPRGVSKSRACIDEWWKEVAPSTELRKWFSHDPAKWTAFKQQYTDELEANHEKLARFVSHAGQGPITLVYGAKNIQHNQAVVLKEFIETRIL